MREEGLADADWTDDEHVVVGVQEAKRGELVEESVVEGDVGRRVPGLELGLGVERSLLCLRSVAAWPSRRCASSCSTRSRKS
jgi:hypothetical protein